MTLVGFVRHGETDWNNQKRKQGHTDIALNEAGRRQAEAIARRLSRERWDAIISSDLARAKETAEVIARSLELGIKTDPRLRERHFGLIEGTTEEERVHKFGPQWRTLKLGIEKREHLRSRGLHFIESVVSRYPEGKIVVVSHGGWIRQVIKALSQPGEQELQNLGNTSLSILTSKGMLWEPVVLNCTAHLTDNSTI